MKGVGSDWVYWMRWDRIQQELRGGVHAFTFTEMNDRWGKQEGKLHNTITRALGKCRTRISITPEETTRESLR